jgi:hypothetical protein
MKARRVVMYALPYVAFLLIGIAPFLVCFTAAGITELFGQHLNEGNAPDIPVIGHLLYAMGVFGWFVMFTIPLALGGIVIYTLVLLGLWIYRLARRGKNRSAVS